MSRTGRSFSSEFKLQVVREVEAGSTVAQIARLHQLHPNLVIYWCMEHSVAGTGVLLEGDKFDHGRHNRVPSKEACKHVQAES